MNILALDLGKFNTTCCLFNSKTRRVTGNARECFQRPSWSARVLRWTRLLPTQSGRDFNSTITPDIRRVITATKFKPSILFADNFDPVDRHARTPVYEPG